MMAEVWCFIMNQSIWSSTKVKSQVLQKEEIYGVQLQRII